MYEQSFHGDHKIENAHFLVTGGAGFIGSHIAEYLMKFGAGKVTVLDNLATGNYDNIKAFVEDTRFEFVNGDIRDLDVCNAVCADADYVLHQAALGSIPRSLAHPDQTNGANVTGFVNMVIAAKENNVKRMVYASSSSVYGDSPKLPKVESEVGRQISPYAVSKYADELYAYAFHLNYGLEIVGLRYFNIFGPRQNPKGEYAAVIPKFINNLIKGEQIFIDGDGEQSRDFTFVENAVQANIKALFTQEEGAVGQVYNVAVGENFSLNTMVDYLKKIIGTDMEPIHRDPRKGDVRNSLADIEKARKLLNYDPQIRFYDGLDTTTSFFKGISG